MKEEEQAGKNKLSGMTDPRFYSPKPSCITSDTARGSFGQVSVRNYYTQASGTERERVFSAW